LDKKRHYWFKKRNIKKLFVLVKPFIFLAVIFNKFKTIKYFKAMKKTLMMMAVVLFTSAAFAQTTAPAATTTTTTTTTPTKTLTPAEKAQMKTLRQDVRAYDKEKAAAKTAIKDGNMTAAKADLTAAKADKAAIATQRTELKSEGLIHPEDRAIKEVKHNDEKAVRTELGDIKTAKATEQADIKAGDPAAATTEKADIKADKAQLKKDIREARRDGIKHPIRRA
jgi:hypothetical protein